MQKIRVDLETRRKLSRVQIFSALFCVLYLFASTISAYAPPFIGLSGFVLLVYSRKNKITWSMIYLALLCTLAELLHGFYAFGCILAVLFVRYFLFEKLVYKLVKKELLIAMIIVLIYALIFAFNAFFAYVEEDFSFKISALLVYYAAAESALACLFLRDRL